MTQPAKSQEPSMEEILASIRRIIADDDATKAQPESPKAAAPAPRPPAPPPRMSPPPPLPPRPIAAPRVEPQPVVHEPAPESHYPPADRGHGAIAEDGEGADILDLTESMAAPPPPAAPSPAPVAAPAGPAAAPGFRTINAQPDVFFDEEPPAAPVQTIAEPSIDNYDNRELLSSSASAAVDSAFSTLASGVLTQNSRTLEDLVREMLRPMLKSWLDDNLPGVVERLVRAEIERVSRGRNS
jgi:hypothetical protein